MPIKPENKARYPADWKQIRERILKRAGHKCERCQAPDRTRIARGTDDDTGTYMTADADVYSDVDGRHLGQCRFSDYSPRMVFIVLTIAHLNHTPEHCDDDNLQALCQQCHLRLDAKHHAATAQGTRHARKAIGDLFDGGTHAQ